MRLKPASSLDRETKPPPSSAISLVKPRCCLAKVADASGSSTLSESAEAVMCTVTPRLIVCGARWCSCSLADFDLLGSIPHDNRLGWYRGPGGETSTERRSGCIEEARLYLHSPAPHHRERKDPPHETTG